VTRTEAILSIAEPITPGTSTRPVALGLEGPRTDHQAAQGVGRARPGRRPADHLLAPGTPPPHPGATSNSQPVFDPARRAAVSPDRPGF
jgi:hypothetical protein